MGQQMLQKLITTTMQSMEVHKVSVHWRVPLQRDDDDQDQVVLSWWGGQLVLINKYR